MARDSNDHSLVYSLQIAETTVLKNRKRFCPTGQSKRLPMRVGVGPAHLFQVVRGSTGYMRRACEIPKMELIFYFIETLTNFLTMQKARRMLRAVPLGKLIR